MAFRDTWHRALVYFGLAEERSTTTSHDPEREPEAELEDRYRERPNVGACPAAGATSSTTSSPTTSRREPAHARAASRRAADGARGRGDVRVHLVIPKSFNDAQQIADKFKDAIPVILNLQGSDTDLSKRLIDFASRPHVRARRRHAADRRQGVPAHAAQRRGLRRGARAADREGLLQPVA